LIHPHQPLGIDVWPSLKFLIHRHLGHTALMLFHCVDYVVPSKPISRFKINKWFCVVVLHYGMYKFVGLFL